MQSHCMIRTVLWWKVFDWSIKKDPNSNQDSYTFVLNVDLMTLTMSREYMFIQKTWCGFFQAYKVLYKCLETTLTSLYLTMEKGNSCTDLLNLQIYMEIQYMKEKQSLVWLYSSTQPELWAFLLFKYVTFLGLWTQRFKFYRSLFWCSCSSSLG